MILAAPPATAMTYVKPSRGLDPSVYGGGGSPSSVVLLDGSPLMSRGKAALSSASTALVPVGLSNGEAGANDGRVDGSGSVTCEPTAAGGGIK